jgi:hypothetical protein
MVLRDDNDPRFARDHAFETVTRSLQAAPVVVVAIAALIAAATWATISRLVRRRPR